MKVTLKGKIADLFLRLLPFFILFAPLIIGMIWCFVWAYLQEH